MILKFYGIQFIFILVNYCQISLCYNSITGSCVPCFFWLPSGVIASLAPLTGAVPTVDKNVSKWLHVHVRPSVRGLLRVLRTARDKKVCDALSHTILQVI